MRTILIGLILACCCNVCVSASSFSYEFTFDDPMSWADDISPRGTALIQSWEIADGGNPGKSSGISAAVYEQPVSCEARTLQFNHKSGVPAKVSFDIKAVSNPPGSYLMVRYFDWYCGGMPFVKIADKETNPATNKFPPPSWDGRHTSASFEPAIMHELCHERFSEQTGFRGRLSDRAYMLQHVLPPGVDVSQSLTALWDLDHRIQLVFGSRCVARIMSLSTGTLAGPSSGLTPWVMSLPRMRYAEKRTTSIS